MLKVFENCLGKMNLFGPYWINFEPFTLQILSFLSVTVSLLHQEPEVKWMGPRDFGLAAFKIVS
jgi:hypothetical protein